MKSKTIMRYLSVIAVAFAITSNAILTSCNNDEEYCQETEVEQETRAAVSEQNSLKLSKQELTKVLKFANEEEFERMAAKLDKMDHADIATVVKSKEGQFISLLDIYEMAMEDAAELDTSKESYYSYKGKYSPYLFFANYLDDCSAYLPVSKKGYAALLNAMGNVEIGGRIVNKLDVKDYLSLQKSGKAMYASASTQSTGSWSYGYIEHSNWALSESSGNVGQEFDSGWWTESDRKIRLKCGRVITQEYGGYILKMHLEVSFRKKTWLGWVNYSSKTSTTGSFSGGYANNNYSYTEEGSSSHDDYQVIPRAIAKDEYGGTHFLANPLTGNLNVYFRGIEYLAPISFTIAALDARIN